MYGAGETFDELLDRLFDAGGPPPRWGRKTGEHAVWLNCRLPAGHVERHGETLEIAARNILLLDLTVGDKERDEALTAKDKP